MIHLAVDERDARCLLQPAISCRVWHWVSMILSTSAHIARYIKHTHNVRHMHMYTHTHTYRTQIQPTWVVKLAPCISGIDLCSIEACHCCHLNFGLGTFPKSPPCHRHHHHRHRRRQLPLHRLHQSGKWMGHRPQTVHLRRGRASLSPITAEQTSYDSPGKKKKKMSGRGKKAVLSHFCKRSPLVSSSSPLWNISLLLKPKPTGAKKPAKPLIEIAILSDEISPRHRFTNRVVISLGQVRCLFISAPP